MKQIFVAATLLLVTSTAFSQRFINGIGVCVFSTTGSGIHSAVTAGITYSPRVNLVEFENSSVSIGLPLSVGLSFSTSTYLGNYDDNYSASAVLNIPLVVNYNFGCGSTRHNKSRIGFFAGGGFAYHYAAYAGTDNNGYDDNSEIHAYGAIANAGVRFGVGRRSRKRGLHNIEIKGSYMKGLDVSSANIFGGAAIFNF